ncbi:hypothetical protein ACLKA6_015826 [Drosophila palustris]
MHTLRFAVLLLLVIASQANVIKNPEHSLEQQQSMEIEAEQPSRVANEVPVVVEQGNVISEAKESLVADVPQEVSNIEAAPEEDKVSDVEVATVPEVIVVDEAAPVEKVQPKLPNVVSKVEAAPVQKKQPKLPNVMPKDETASAQKEQLNKEKFPNVIDKVEAAPVEKKLPNVISKVEAAPVQKKQPKLPNVMPKDEAASAQKEQLNKEKLTKVEAAPVEKLQPKLPNVVSKVEAAPVQKKQPKLPNAMPKLEEAAPVHKVQPKLPNVSAKIEAAPEQEKLSNAIVKIESPQIQKPIQEPKDNVNLNENTEQVAVQLEGSDNQVVNQAEPEARTKLGNPDYFYIVEEGVSGSDTSNSTAEKPTKHTHTHEHIYYKPALFPFPPLPYEGSSGSQGHGNKHTLGQNGAGGHKNSNHSNKYGSSSSSSNVDKGHVYGSSAFYPLPLLPIPFWKPGHNYNSNQKYNKTTWTDEDDQLYNYKPNYYDGYPPFYVKERRAPSGSEQASKDNQQGLVLIGHIFLHIRPQAGKGESATVPLTGNSKPNPSEDNPSSDVKIEEPFHNSQLLLQPVVYPATNKKNKDNSHPLPHQIPQINEIYRSLHLVHPSTQERSAQPSEVNEDGAVLFAVEIPKPIYRFFKSVFGVFSY